MKQCIKCNVTKDKSQFEKERNQCRACRYDAKKARPQKTYEVSITERECLCCKVVKPADQFDKNARHTTGLVIYCKECRSGTNKKKYEENPEPKKAQSVEYYKNNKPKAMAQSKLYKRHKAATDPRFVLVKRLRSRLLTALKNTIWKKNTKFSEYIGCDRDTLMSHIESQFVEGMSWDNRNLWHIDHKIPLISAKTEEELYKLCHYTNLQPMWAVENIRKGGKV